MKIKWLVPVLMSGNLSIAFAQSHFEEAVQSYRHGRWSEAYGRFIFLADAGDPDAARIALFMHRMGPLLYGAYWDADADRLSRWEHLSQSRTSRAAPTFRPVPYSASNNAVSTRSKAH